MNVQFWLADEDNSHLGTWWDEEHPQVPRVGDRVWLETDEVPFQLFNVVGVQWSFKARMLGSLSDRSIKAEVHVRPLEALRKPPTAAVEQPKEKG